jgi:cyclohexyl-isocyanide hydratase
MARTLQLAFEYDPQPPFDCGSPEKAGPERVARLRAMQGERVTRAEAQIARAALVGGV